jgi:hypothetical protein
MESMPNQVVCPECGRVRMETPPGTTALPTIGMARKAAGVGHCDCGRPHAERPGNRAGEVDEAGEVRAEATEG